MAQQTFRSSAMRAAWELLAVVREITVFFRPLRAHAAFAAAAGPRLATSPAAHVS